LAFAPWLRRQFDTAVEVPRWAWAFYRRHFLLVAGLSLIPAAQRVVWALWNERLPGTLNVVLEALTLAVRLLLLVLIARLAFSSPAAANTDAGPRRGVWAFLRERWASILLQWILLGCVAAVFDLVPERIIGPRVPADLQRAYWAALLGLKNPTVIAFTMVWMVGAVRQAKVYPRSIRRPEPSSGVPSPPAP
jgi:hypothetical protein